MLRSTLALTLCCFASHDDPIEVDELRGELADGTVLERDLVVTHELESTLIEIFFGDEAQEADGTLELGFENRNRTIDRTLATEDGRLTAFERTYSELARTETQGDGATSEELDWTSPYESAALRFDLDEGEWTATDPEDEYAFDAEDLARLGADLGLRCLLPDEAVAIGDSWEVDGRWARLLLDPAGDLLFEVEELEVPEIFDEVLEDMWTNIDAEIEVEYAGRTEVDDEALESFEVTFEIAGDGEAREEIDDPNQEGEAVLEHGMSFDGTATLLWNPTTGHAHSFTLEAETEMRRTMGAELVAPDGSVVPTGQRFEFTGELSVELVTNAVEDE
jgi:hypothetical protein